MIKLFWLVSRLEINTIGLNAFILLLYIIYIIIYYFHSGQSERETFMYRIKNINGNIERWYFCITFTYQHCRPSTLITMITMFCSIKNISYHTIHLSVWYVLLLLCLNSVCTYFSFLVFFLEIIIHSWDYSISISIRLLFLFHSSN